MFGKLINYYLICFICMLYMAYAAEEGKKEFGPANNRFTGKGVAALKMFDTNFKSTNYLCKDMTKIKEVVDEIEINPSVSSSERLCGEEKTQPCLASVYGALQHNDCNENCMYHLTLKFPNALGTSTDVEMWVRVVDAPSTQSTIGSEATGKIIFEIEARAFVGFCQTVCVASGNVYCVRSQDCSSITGSGSAIAHNIQQSDNLSHCQQTGVGKLTNIGNSQTNCPEVLQQLSNIAIPVDWRSEDCEADIQIHENHPTDFNSAVDHCDNEKLLYRPVEEGTTCGSSVTQPCGAVVNGLEEDEDKFRCNCSFIMAVHLPTCVEKTCKESYALQLQFIQPRGHKQATSGIHPQLIVDKRVVDNVAIPSIYTLCHNDNPPETKRHYYVSTVEGSCEDGYSIVVDIEQSKIGFINLVNSGETHATISNCITPNPVVTIIIIVVVILIIIAAIVGCCLCCLGRKD